MVSEWGKGPRRWLVLGLAVALVIVAGCSSRDDDDTAEATPVPAPPFAVGRRTMEDAPPAEGRFPLVVWAHGWNSTGETFLPYAELWARQGYVVALPTFPLSREGVADGDDVQNQPGDVSFVIDQVLAL